MDQTREELLRAWMSLSAYIRGNRLLRELSMNEMLVCNLLYRRQEESGPQSPPRSFARRRSF